MQPTIGRIVHFKNGEETQAAMILAVHNETSVDLITWNRHGTSTSFQSVSLGDGAQMWSWPPRV